MSLRPDPGDAPDLRDLFERIAAALERLAPPDAPPLAPAAQGPAPYDWDTAPGYVWDGLTATAIPRLEAVLPETLRGIDRQKAAFAANLAWLASGAAAHDTLLWGARGMGKSALVRSAVADIQRTQPGRLALVQIAPGALPQVPALLGELAQRKRAFLLFVDDLGFGPDQQQDMLALRSLLDGGILPRAAHIRIAVTSNRRAIVERDVQGNEPLHPRDARDDALALADRFGLTLGFHPCDRETYLEILRGYTDPLGLTVNEEEALAWAIERGNRSGRTAVQFATELAGRAGIAL